MENKRFKLYYRVFYYDLCGEKENSWEYVYAPDLNSAKKELFKKLDSYYPRGGRTIKISIKNKYRRRIYGK